MQDQMVVAMKGPWKWDNGAVNNLLDGYDDQKLNLSIIEGIGFDQEGQRGWLSRLERVGMWMVLAERANSDQVHVVHVERVGHAIVMMTTLSPISSIRWLLLCAVGS